jgi:hypothetical protein
MTKQLIVFHCCKAKQSDIFIITRITNRPSASFRGASATWQSKHCKRSNQTTRSVQFNYKNKLITFRHCEPMKAGTSTTQIPTHSSLRDTKCRGNPSKTLNHSTTFISANSPFSSLRANESRRTITTPYPFVIASDAVAWQSIIASEAKQSNNTQCSATISCLIIKNKLNHSVIAS